MLTKHEVFVKYRMQLERGIISPEDYARRCYQDLLLERAGVPPWEVEEA